MNDKPTSIAAAGASMERIVTSWIAAHVGPVVRIVRQGRWRPAWFVDARLADGEVRKLYVRGERADAVAQPQPLSYECKVFQLLEASHVRVPHVRGYIDELPAIVMDWVEGRTDVNTVEDPQARDAIRLQFVDQMIAMHRVDPELMRAAGAPRPAGGNTLALAYFRRIEAAYLAKKRRPEPAIEFIRRWITLNTPDHPDVAYPIAVDAGQFLFAGDRLTALLDFEYSTLGDFHTDLAALRLRNRLEPIGDISELYKLYEQRSGVSLNIDRIRFHTVIKGVLPPMHMAEVLSAPPPGVDFHQYMVWNAIWLRLAIESIAEMKGWNLVLDRPLYTPIKGRFNAVLDLLLQDEIPPSAGDGFEGYQMDRRRRLLGFLSRLVSQGSQLETTYAADIAGLCGTAPQDWAQADALLEAFVQDSPPERDEHLARIIWQHLNRQCELLADPQDPRSIALLCAPLAAIGSGRLRSNRSGEER